MRLFVAVYPPQPALDALAAALPALPPQWRRVPPQQWHLTLAFLAEVPDGRVADLSERLGRAAARSRPVPLALAGGGGFPSRRRARVLWAGVRGEPDALRGLTRLAARVAAAARRAGLDLADSRYRPHLTLARSRVPGGVDATGPVLALARVSGPEWTASRIVLVRSRLGAQVRHEAMASWALAGASAGAAED